MSISTRSLFVGLAAATLFILSVGASPSHAGRRHPKHQTALDSLTAGIEGVSVTGTSNRLEGYLSKYPNSAQLDQAIGKLFLFSSRLYTAQYSATVCGDTSRISNSDSAIYWLERARSIDERYSEEGHRLTDWLVDAYLAKTWDAIRAGDADLVRRVLKKARSEDLLSHTALALSAYILDSLPQDAIYVTSRPTSSKSDLGLAVLYLHIIKDQRPDISIVMSDMLLDDEYLQRVRTGLDGVQKPVVFDAAACLAKVSEELLATSALGVDSLPLSAKARATLITLGVPDPPGKIYEERQQLSSGTWRRSAAILSGNRWERPVAFDYRSSAGNAIASRSGLFSIVYPEGALPSEDLHRFSAARTFATLRNQRFLEIVTTDFDSAFSWVPFDLAEASIYVDIKTRIVDTASVVEVFKTLWAIPALRQGNTNTLSFSQLAIFVYPTYKPAGIDEYLTNIYHMSNPLLALHEDGIDESSIQSTALYVMTAKLLNKCDEVESTLQQLKQMRKTDTTNRVEIKGIVGYLSQYMQYLGCKEFQPQMAASISRPLPFSLDSMLRLYAKGDDRSSLYTPRYYKPQDSVMLICNIFGGKPGKTVTMKLYYETTSTLLRIDSAVCSTPVVIPPEIRVQLPREMDFYSVAIPINFGVPFAIGDYVVDVLMGGQVRTTAKFQVADPKLESELR